MPGEVIGTTHRYFDEVNQRGSEFVMLVAAADKPQVADQSEEQTAPDSLEPKIDQDGIPFD